MKRIFIFSSVAGMLFFLLGIGKANAQHVFTELYMVREKKPASMCTAKPAIPPAIHKVYNLNPEVAVKKPMKYYYDTPYKPRPKAVKPKTRITIH